MTAQIGDTLLFAGKRFGLASEPLAPWLQRRRNRHLRLRGNTTANRRGYVAEWEVVDGLLHLKQIVGKLLDDTPLEIQTLFPDATGPVPATWFTGGLRCPMGKMLHYVHSGYDTVSEYDLILWFIEGQLVEQRLNRNRLPQNIAPDDDDIDAELEID